jgi:soluble cytochrome b562
MSRTVKLPLKTFWDTVEQRLLSCSTDELRAILRVLARDVPPSERHAFLDRLQPAAGTEGLALEAIQQDDLLADIADLAQELQNEMESPQSEWEEWDDEDNLGPYAPFVDSLSILFDRTDAVFDQGNLSLARAAYRKLFDALALEDDYGRGVKPDHLDDVDCHDARARYLCAVYETEPPARRATVLLEQFQDAPTREYSGRPSLQQLLDVAPRPLSDFATFLSDWIALLRQDDGYETDAWLREAIRLAHGTAGLAELARREGQQRPRAFLDWCTALAEEGAPAEALAAAQEALRVLPEALPIRAVIADQLCAAAARLDQPETVQAGRWQAFLAKPTLLRLLDLWEATPPPARVGRMQQAVEHLRVGLTHPPAYGPNDHWHDDELETPVRVSETTVVHACLLAGDWSAAHQLGSEGKLLGWSSNTNPQGLVVVALLMLLAGKLPAALPANLRQLWVQCLENSFAFGQWKATSDEAVSPLQRLDQLYAERLAQATLDHEQQAQFLNWCLEVAKQRTDTIVGGQHRGSYDKAATLISACAEVLRLRGERQEASALLTEVRNRFSRHRAFHRELSLALDKSIG